MREIKFRGKRLDNGEWVYGYYFSSDEMPKRGEVGHFIKCGLNEEFRIIPETVGQFTERKDKNEVEVYDEDIVKVQHEIYHQIIGRVSFEDGQWIVTESDGEKWNLYWLFWTSIEVIGNMFDNPELLENPLCS